eukprot:5893779-Pyramimonas_sp.AAC.1
MAARPRATKQLWTRCKSCQECEWNKKLQSYGCICSGRGATVPLFTPTKKVLSGIENPTTKGTTMRSVERTPPR